MLDSLIVYHINNVKLVSDNPIASLFLLNQKFICKIIKTGLFGKVIN
jgi:hypothetical protein